MGGTLPAALLCAALGLALSFAPAGSLLRCLGALILPAIAVALLRLPVPQTAALFGCWLSVMLTAAAVHLPKGLPSIAAVILSVNAGIWIGTVVASTGSPADLGIALPCALIAWPGRMLAQTRLAIALKVVASWLIAVAILGATLPFAPTLLGYQPDHLE